MKVARREFRWVLLLTVILVAGLFIAANWHHAIHKNDPTAFAERADAALNGELPYIDFEFEHLPLALVPMAAVGLLQRALGNVHYTLIFWFVMGGVLFAVGTALNGLGRRLGVEDAALRWVKISWALLPLIAFRIDAISLLLVIVALSLSIDGKERESAWALGAGIATKGWPIVLAVVDWWRDRRTRAVITVMATVAGGVVLAAFPLFRSGREFFGVHIETVTGSATAFIRSLSGSSTLVDVAAGASYVAVGRWAMVLNALIGLTLGFSALRVLRTRFSWERAVDLIGVLTIAVMLLSPLLSAQFVIWITPFAALSRSPRVRTGATVSCILTGAFVTFWFMDYSWWWAIIVARNVALLWTGWTWSQFAARRIEPVHEHVAETIRL